MIKALFQKAKDKLREAKTAKACAKGLHRWAHVTEKLEDGTATAWRVCQDCGVKDGAS